MLIQKSYKNDQSDGKLFLVATPIGNLEDITYRAINTLQSVDIIAAEDTRQTIKLLNHFQIKKRLISYHEHNKETSGKELISMLKKGLNIALVSDAGLPAISDPGTDLVMDAIDHNINVIPIPGANAGITGLIASGLQTETFTFIGFLPRDKKELKQRLNDIRNFKETLIIYEAPHRVKKNLKVLLEILGNRRMVMIRELTKLHEEFLRGTVEEMNDFVEEKTIKGEITIILEGSQENTENSSEDELWERMTITEHVEMYLEEGKTAKEAIKEVAMDRKISKREVYQIYHHL